MSTSLDDRWHELDRAAYEIPHDHDRLPEREPLLIERLRIAATFGLDDPRLELSHANLLHYYYCDVGDYTRVEIACRYWIALKQDQLTTSRHDLHVLQELAGSLTIQHGVLGSDEAEALYRRALALAEDAHGADDPQVDGPLFLLGQYLYNAQKYGKAIEIGERLCALRERQRRAGARDRMREGAPWYLRDSYQELGRLADVEALQRQSLEDLMAEQCAEVDPRPGMTLSQLADTVAAQGCLDEALELKREALSQIARAFDALSQKHERWRTEMAQRGITNTVSIPRDPERFARQSYADLLRRVGRCVEAEDIYRDELTHLAVDADQQPLAWQPPALGRAYRDATTADRRATILAGLAAVFQEAGRSDEAAAYAQEAADLQACASALRERANRIARRLWLRDPKRQARLTVDEVRRLLDTPISLDPSSK